MRIATWNVGRPATGAKHARLLEWIERMNADIWVLTDTPVNLRPSARYALVHAIASDRSEEPGQTRVAIWSRLPIRALGATTHADDSVAAMVNLPSGVELIVYGSAAVANDDPADWLRLQQEYPDAEFCVVGPMMPKQMEDAFHDAGVSCVTQGYEDPVFAQSGGGRVSTHHLVVSHSLADRDTSRGCWPVGSAPTPELSDQFGIYVDFD
jgi:hypothetical protein